MKTVFTTLYNFFTNRLFLLAIMVVGAFYVLISNLFRLQVVEGEAYANDFNMKVIREVNSEGQRGNIYDRFGVPLAQNIMAYDVLLNDSYEVKDKNAMILDLIQIIEGHGDEVINVFPLVYEDGAFAYKGSDHVINQFLKGAYNETYIAGLSEEELATPPTEMFYYLCGEDYFDIDLSQYTVPEAMAILNIRFAQHIRRYSKYQPETIARNISQATLAELEEKRDYFPGVSIIESPYRVYNDAKYFAHLIGYTRDISAEKLELMAPLGYDADDQVGFVGIEKELEAYLRGYDGKQIVEVNNLGKTMLTLEEKPPVMGNDVYLTIDHDLQIETYHILEQKMAEILVDKLYRTYPKAGDTRYVLLKDVFDSIFRYELIDIDGLQEAQSEAANSIYAINENLTEAMVATATKEIRDNTPAKGFDQNKAVYHYIFEQLKLKEYLPLRFYRNDYYELFVKGDITFHQLMQALFEGGQLVIPLNEGEIVYAKLPEREEDDDTPLATDFDVDPVLMAHMNDFIFNDFLLRPYMKKFMYLHHLDEEVFDYVTLTHAVIDMGLVSATDLEREQLSRRRLKPIDFMKEKILNIEITPQQLALDPSAGAVVISDVDTGEVLALVSYPSYDNNRLVNNFDGRYYLEQQKDPTLPMFPRATMSTAVPGSTFKMLVGLAAMEEGLIGPDDYIHAHGKFDKIWPPAVCWIYSSKGASHGPLDMAGAIEVSCNYFFYEMGYRLGITEEGKYSPLQGISTLQDYIAKAGLDTKTGLEISEVKGTLPELDPVRAAIGQEKNGYTPVQLSRYTNMLADGGAVRELNLVDKVLDKKGDVVVEFTPKVLAEESFDPAYLAAINQGMYDVTSGSRGTARSYFADLPLAVAGKTGTAEIVSYDNKSDDPVLKVIKRPNHAVFTGYAPYDNPEVSVVTFIQFAYSSKYAALTSKEVFRNYFDLERGVDSLHLTHHLE